MRKIHLFLIIISLVVGCAGASSFMPSESFMYYPEYDGTVLVYYNNFPTEGYVKLGIVRGTGYLATDTDTIINSMKKRAAKVGANAIVIMGDRQYRPGSFSSLSAPHEMSAWAIRIKDKKTPDKNDSDYLWTG